MEEVSETSSYSESFHWLWKDSEADPVGDPVAFHMPNTAAAFSTAWSLLEIGSNGVMLGDGGMTCVCREASLCYKLHLQWSALCFRAPRPEPCIPSGSAVILEMPVTWPQQGYVLQYPKPLKGLGPTFPLVLDVMLGRGQDEGRK